MKILNLNRFLVRFWLWMHNFSVRLIHRYAIRLEGGLHPKHRIMNYHKFFIDHINEGDTVLDIGCGNGALTRDVAQKAKKVIGIDISRQNINIAETEYNTPNIEYIFGDATTYNFKQKFDVIIMSNVLEHIDKRNDFLQSIKELAPKLLIRVPAINRDWITYYKKEQKVEWRLDSTHFTEYTVNSLVNEFEEVGLSLTETNIKFGEFWVVAE